MPLFEPKITRSILLVLYSWIKKFERAIVQKYTSSNKEKDYPLFAFAYKIQYWGRAYILK